MKIRKTRLISNPIIYSFSILILIVVFFLFWLLSQSNHQWRTYLNNDLGISFIYPSQLKIRTVNRAIVIDNEKISSDGIVVEIKNTSFKRENIADIYGQIEDDRLQIKFLAGRQAFYYVTGDGGCGAEVYALPYRNGEKILEFSFGLCEGEKEIVTPVRDRILASFKFIEPAKLKE